MTSFLIIAISTAISVIASAAVDCYLLKTHKVGSEEYKALLKFARNNKKIKNYQDIFEDIYKKISDLENRISGLPFNPKSDNYDVIELRKEIAALKNEINAFQVSETADNSNISKVKDTLIKLTSRVLSLENKLSELSVPVSVDTSALETEIEELRKIADKNNMEIVLLKQTVTAQQQMIDLLKKGQSVPENHTSDISVTSNPAPETTVRPKAKFFTSPKIIIPDAEYVKMLISNLSMIKNELGVPEYRHYAEALHNLLDDDFEDSEEIMGTVHGLIEKYIYGSDTKVSASSWTELEKYIISAGYVPVPVKAGDDVTKYRSYFSRPIPAAGGPENTIKQIQLQPYILTYEDNGEKETLKLCGKCTYYK